MRALLAILLFAMIYSCKKEDELLPACGSDTLRYIVSNGSKLKIDFDQSGKVISFQPTSNLKPFIFRDIILNEKAIVKYNSDGTPSKIELESGGTYMTYEYWPNQVTKNKFVSDFDGKYSYFLNSSGKVVSQYKYLPVNPGIPPPRAGYTKQANVYNQDNNIEKTDEFTLDFNYPGDRLWKSYSYSYDSKSNPLLNTLILLTVQEDASILSENNCVSTEVTFALRGNTPLGKTFNQLKYDTKNRLVYLKTGEGKFELEFSYCDD